MTTYAPAPRIDAMTQDLTGEIAIVTGAGRVIGAATGGARVVSSYRVDRILA